MNEVVGEINKKTRVRGKEKRDRDDQPLCRPDSATTRFTFSLSEISSSVQVYRAEPVRVAHHHYPRALLDLAHQRIAHVGD